MAALIMPPSTSDVLLANSPPVNAILEESTLSSLRAQQHRDANGNIISKRLETLSHCPETDLLVQPILTCQIRHDRAWRDP